MDYKLLLEEAYKEDNECELLDDLLDFINYVSVDVLDFINKNVSYNLTKNYFDNYSAYIYCNLNQHDFIFWNTHECELNFLNIPYETLSMNINFCDKINNKNKEYLNSSNQNNLSFFLENSEKSHNEDLNNNFDMNIVAHNKNHFNNFQDAKF